MRGLKRHLTIWSWGWGTRSCPSWWCSNRAATVVTCQGSTWAPSWPTSTSTWVVRLLTLARDDFSSGKTVFPRFVSLDWSHRKLITSSLNDWGKETLAIIKFHCLHEPFCRAFSPTRKKNHEELTARLGSEISQWRGEKLVILISNHVWCWSAHTYLSVPPYQEKTPRRRSYVTWSESLPSLQGWTKGGAPTTSQA